MKPITPHEVPKAREAYIPPEVIEAFNNLITKHFVRNAATFNQDMVIDEILSIMNGPASCGKADHVTVTRHMIFENKWLDIEPLFSNYGWKVEYESPAYCETFKAYFTFRKV